MNCKPGDLAIVVGYDYPAEVADLGKICEVIRPGEDWSDVGDSRPHWYCRWPRPVTAIDVYTGAVSMEIESDMADAHLRPLPSAQAVQVARDMETAS